MTETETTLNVTEKEYLQARRDYDESARSILEILQNSENRGCLLYTSPSPRDRQKSRMPSSA